MRSGSSLNKKHPNLEVEDLNPEQAHTLQLKNVHEQVIKEEDENMECQNEGDTAPSTAQANQDNLIKGLHDGENWDDQEL